MPVATLIVIIIRLFFTAYFADVNLNDIARSTDLAKSSSGIIMSSGRRVEAKALKCSFVKCRFVIFKKEELNIGFDTSCIKNGK